MLVHGFLCADQGPINLGEVDKVCDICFQTRFLSESEVHKWLEPRKITRPESYGHDAGK
jgi:hypothetical protein